MARGESKQQKRKGVQVSLPFTKTNYQIFAVAALVILAGYVALAQAPWDGTMPLVVAPILLVLGYCVIIPYGILHRAKPVQASTVMPPGVGTPSPQNSPPPQATNA